MVLFPRTRPYLVIRGMATMKAIVVSTFGPPDVMKVEAVKVPEYGEKEVLVRLNAAGVNPVDTYLRSGVYPTLPQLPYTPGKDAAGIVEAVGTLVNKFKIGDRVFCTSGTGSYAEYGSFPENRCWPLPGRLTFAQGACIGVPYFTAYRALFQIAQARPSDTILVHGASGAVGLAVVQLAKANGMTIFGTAGSEEGMKLVMENGATGIFNHRTAGYTETIMKATNGKGLNVIIEMRAHVNLGKDLELLDFNGTVVVVGSRGTVEINPRLLMTKNSSVRGMSLLAPTEQRNWDDMSAALMAGLENGTLNPIVDKEYSLDDAPKAHKEIMANDGAKGNLVLSL